MFRVMVPLSSSSSDIVDPLDLFGLRRGEVGGGEGLQLELKRAESVLKVAYGGHEVVDATD